MVVFITGSNSNNNNSNNQISIAPYASYRGAEQFSNLCTLQAAGADESTPPPRPLLAPRSHIQSPQQPAPWPRPQSCMLYMYRVHVHAADQQVHAVEHSKAHGSRRPDAVCRPFRRNLGPLGRGSTPRNGPKYLSGPDAVTTPSGRHPRSSSTGTHQTLRECLSVCMDDVDDDHG